MGTNLTVAENAVLIEQALDQAAKTRRGKFAHKMALQAQLVLNQLDLTWWLSEMESCLSLAARGENPRRPMTCAGKGARELAPLTLCGLVKVSDDQKFYLPVVPSWLKLASELLHEEVS